MIEIRFEERVKIGLQYVLESLHGCSPFGQEKIRRLRFYTPEERAELETELYNVERAAAAAEELKGQYTKLMTGLCQMKDIRTSLRRCAAGETPDHVELFEIKGYLQRLDGLRPLLAEIDAVTHFKGIASTTPSPRWPFWTRTAPAAGASTSPTAPPPSSRRSVRPRRTLRSVFSRRRRTRRRTTCA